MGVARSPWIPIEEFDFRLCGGSPPDDMVLDVTVVADDRTVCKSCGRSNRATMTIYSVAARWFADARTERYTVEGRVRCNGCKMWIAFDLAGHFSAVRIADPPATGRTGEGLAL